MISFHHWDFSLSLYYRGRQVHKVFPGGKFPGLFLVHEYLTGEL